jgi:type IV pilus assembly protein PilA
MIKKELQAFTLIELMVVITIIGILAVIVIPNLTSVRGKGQDGAMKEQISQLRNMSVQYADTNNGFSTGNITPTAAGGATAATCNTASTLFTDANVTKTIVAITSNAGSAPNCALGTASAASGVAQSWAIFSSLRSSASTYWCADSTGNVGTSSSKTGNLVKAATNEVTCP